MTDKERKARDERVKLRREVEKWKATANRFKDAHAQLLDRFTQVEAKAQATLTCYQLLCSSLGIGGKS